MDIAIDIVAQQPPFIRYASSLHISPSPGVLSKPSGSERGSLKLLYDENKIPDQTVTGGENTHLRLGAFKGGLFQRWEPEIPEAGALQRAAEGVAAGSLES